MEITERVVRQMEILARLELEPRERERIRADLERILGYMALLEELDTGAVAPTDRVFDSERPLREDEPRPSLPRELGLASAPSVEGGEFVVPPAIERERGDRA